MRGGRGGGVDFCPVRARLDGLPPTATTQCPSSQSSRALALLASGATFQSALSQFLKYMLVSGPWQLRRVLLNMRVQAVGFLLVSSEKHRKGEFLLVSEALPTFLSKPRRHKNARCWPPYLDFPSAPRSEPICGTGSHCRPARVVSCTWMASTGRSDAELLFVFLLVHGWGQWQS